LVPVSRPHVWAPIDGIVRQVAVEHGAEVAAGQIVAELDSPELELQLQQVKGELSAARLRREGYDLMLRQAEVEKDNPPAELLKISAEIAEIEAEIENHEGHQKFLEELREKLTIRSPIDGQVITWNVAELLANRPVRKGESLMIVGDTSGPWQIEFQVPDRKMKYLEDAQHALGERLPIDCLLAGDPRSQFAGHLDSIASIATAAENAEPGVKVVARFDRAALHQPRVGLSVTGRIYCGRRSLGFIWTYELVDAVRRRFFW
jgi:biotin carboxyl carrier protein